MGYAFINMTDSLQIVPFYKVRYIVPYADMIWLISTVLYIINIFYFDILNLTMADKL